MMTRQQFLRSLAGVGLLVACTKSDGEPEPGADAAPQVPTPDAPPQPPMPDAPPASTCATTNTTIASNHGHVAVVPGADVAAGLEKTYDIKGGSGHPHTIKVTAAMFTMLEAGQMVTVTSSSDAGHTHAVTIGCA